MDNAQEQAFLVLQMAEMVRFGNRFSRAARDHIMSLVRIAYSRMYNEYEFQIARMIVEAYGEV